MDRLLLALALATVVIGAVLVLQRRRPDDAPTQPRTYAAPLQLDRADFPRPDADWLVVAFTSATCGTCEDVRTKVVLLESEDVAVTVVEAAAEPDLHARYRIDAVPIVAVADADGVVQASFIGPVSATHLWGALAELRSPGSVPPGCGASVGHDHAPTEDGTVAGAEHDPT